MSANSSGGFRASLWKYEWPAVAPKPEVTLSPTPRRSTFRCVHGAANVFRGTAGPAGPLPAGR